MTTRKRNLGKWIAIGLTVVILFSVLPLSNYVTGVQAWNRELELLKREKLPSDLSDILPPPLPPGQSYFVDHPWIASQAKWTGDGQNRVYEDPANQEVLKRLGKESTPSDPPTRLKLGSYDPAPQRSDFAQIATAFGLPVPADPIPGLLAYLKPNDPLVSDLAVAATRPAGYLPPYLDVEIPSAITSPHLGVWISVARPIALRSRIHLAAGMSHQAAAELAILFRLCETMDAEPTLLCLMVHLTLQAILMGPIWEGLEQGEWAEVDLARLSAELRNRKPVAHLETALVGERLAFYRNVEFLARYVPDHPGETGFVWPGAILHNKANYSATNRSCLALVQARNWAAIQVFGKDGPLIKEDQDPNWVLARAGWEGIDGLTMAAVRAQAFLTLAQAALALERHYLRHGSFPKSLDAIDPSFVLNSLIDPIDHNPVHYQLTPNGRYVLYSIGWNFLDDGGKPAPKNSNDGDWAWSYTDQTTLPKRP